MKILRFRSIIKPYIACFMPFSRKSHKLGRQILCDCRRTIQRQAPQLEENKWHKK